MRGTLRLAALVAWGLVGAWGTASCLAAEPPQVLLRASTAIDTVDQVDLSLEVGGDLRVTDAGKTRSLPMSVVAKQTFLERRITAPAERLRALRHYEAADVTIKIDSDSSQPTLRDDRRLVCVDVADDRPTLFSPYGPLTRDEFDLVAVQGNTLLLDRLLPDRPVAVGDSWTHAPALVAGLLALDAVSQADVTSKLQQLDDAAARCELTGTVQGAIGGVATEIEVMARYRFDRAAGRVNWFALLIKEKRSIGHAAPGLDVTARLLIERRPGNLVPALADAAVADLNLEPGPEKQLLLYEARQTGFRFLYDARWQIAFDQSDVVALRLIDRGDLIAQCNISPVRSTSETPTLAEFQADVKRSLDKHFGQFIKASESTTAQGYQLLRVSVSGIVAELPIEWHYYLLSAPSGQRAAFAFTVESELIERLAGGDEALISTVEFFEPPVATAQQPTEATK